MAEGRARAAFMWPDQASDTQASLLITSNPSRPNPSPHAACAHTWSDATSGPTSPHPVDRPHLVRRHQQAHQPTPRSPPTPGQTPPAGPPAHTQLPPAWGRARRCAGST
eukprot:349956-Chlamydomonas_euryale.AAC.4